MDNTNLADIKEDLDNLEQQYLTFRLSEQDYGIPILEVQEIKGWTAVTPIPNSPHFIKGVLNLRGTIVPIIDLRLRFNLERKEYDQFTVIIVVNIAGKLAGLVVDSVSDVVNASNEQHCEAPEFEGQLNRQFIEGLVQFDEKLLILLDISKLADIDDLADVSADQDPGSTPEEN
ncbi:MAG: chemotaxis protein CheW [Acidiferrobacterales bacterium]